MIHPFEKAVGKVSVPFCHSGIYCSKVFSIDSKMDI